MSGMRKIIASVGFVGLLAGCSSEHLQPTTPDRPSEVVYEVGGEIDFSGYMDGLSSDNEFPASNRVVLTGELIHESTLYVFATPEGRYGEAWCRITADGKTLAFDKAKGSANAAYCIGDL